MWDFLFPLRALTCGHNSGLPPWKAPIMVAEKRKLFVCFPEVTNALTALPHGLVNQLSQLLPIVSTSYIPLMNVIT